MEILTSPKITVGMIALFRQEGEPLLQCAPVKHVWNCAGRNPDGLGQLETGQLFHLRTGEILKSKLDAPGQIVRFRAES